MAVSAGLGSAIARETSTVPHLNRELVESPCPKIASRSRPMEMAPQSGLRLHGPRGPAARPMHRCASRNPRLGGKASLVGRPVNGVDRAAGPRRASHGIRSVRVHPDAVCENPGRRRAGQGDMRGPGASPVVFGACV